MTAKTSGDIGLEIREERRGNVSVFYLKGVLDLYTLQEAKDRVARWLEDGGRLLVLDLDEVEYIDSSGLGFFIGTLKKMKEKDGAAQLRLSRLNAYMMGIFRLINLHEVLKVYDDVDAAVESVSGKSTMYGHDGRNGIETCPGGSEEENE